MALIYELIRQGRTGLRVMGWNNGIDVDVLVGAGCVSEVQTAYVGMLKHGLALNFRRAAERGEIDVIEDSELTALARFRAGAMGLPFIPSTSPLGSDLMRFERETRTVQCPFTGRTLAALRAADPDVALLHAHRADERGNVQIDERYVKEGTADVFIGRSARVVIVSVEEIVETAELVRRPDLTGLPGFLVDAVVELPHGAHPCSCHLRSDYDLDFIDRYYGASRSDESFGPFLDRYVREVPDHAGYLERVGISPNVGPST
jgi:glutaconate CoA-transferase subunit A